jgi:glycosyltransferase involved in cell wall biosynthesis
LEYQSVDLAYNWFTEAEKKAAGVICVESCSDGLRLAMAGFRPDVVCVPGWSDPVALQALLLCSRTGIPTVLMSDSQLADTRRFRIIESVKRRLLRLFSAALVAGSPQIEYLRTLGFPEDRIFTGYDVVDNGWFSRGSDQARRNELTLREQFDLPRPYFFCCARLASKKNLLALVEAYEKYRAAANSSRWDLVIAGDGEMRNAIENRIAHYGLRKHCRILGYCDYNQMPMLYGLAEAFICPSRTDQWALVVNEAMAAGLPVLVSRGAGSAIDLVKEGVNGFTFDPESPEELGNLMDRMSSGADLVGMGAASRIIISNWGLERFVNGVTSAAVAAQISPKSSPDFFGRTLTKMLAYR